MGGQGVEGMDVPCYEGTILHLDRGGCMNLHVIKLHKTKYTAEMST